MQAPKQMQTDAFAIRMFQALVQEQRGNVVFSPSSVEGVLRLLQQGARGETARELAALPMGKQHVRTAMQPAECNALFINKGEKLLPGINAIHIITSPLQANPAQAADDINRWCKAGTRGMIPTIISEQILQESQPVALVAANAIALEEKWLRPFVKDKTVERHPFLQADKTRAQVPMMFHTALYRHAEGADWQAAAIFYRTDGRKGEPGCFLAIMPKGDARRFIAGLTPAKYNSIRQALAQAQPEKIRLGLPKFELRTPSFRLDNALKSCGVRHIYSQTADLSGFTGRNDLRLSTVMQRCYVKTDEQGTKAAAATVAVVQVRSIAAGPRTLAFHRPFIWAITDLTSPAAPYFMGLFERP